MTARRLEPTESRLPKSILDRLEPPDRPRDEKVTTRATKAGLSWEDLMNLGDVLKKAREKKKMSADELASCLGISIHEYRVLEAHGPLSAKDRDLIRRAAQALGSSLVELHEVNVEDDPAHAE